MHIVADYVARDNHRPPGQPIDWNGIQFNRADEAYRKGLLPAGLARMDDGLAGRLDRLKAVGNGQVPEVVEFFWEATTVSADEVKKALGRAA